MTWSSAFPWGIRRGYGRRGGFGMNSRKFKRNIEKLVSLARKAQVGSLEELAECGRVAAAFPPHRRHWKVPWEVYVACADMPEEKQNFFMDYYAEHGRYPYRPDEM